MRFPGFQGNGVFGFEAKKGLLFEVRIVIGFCGCEMGLLGLMVLIFYGVFMRFSIL